MRTEEVSNTFAGWVGVETSGKNAAGARVVRVELKGLDQSLRIRQLKVLDKPGPIPDSKGELHIEFIFFLCWPPINLDLVPEVVLLKVSTANKHT